MLNLIKPYWLSNNKRWAWGLLFAVIALNLGMVYVNVRLSFWKNDLFTAVQQLNSDVFFQQLGLFVVLAGSFVLIGVYQEYLKQMLHLKWRQWMTECYLNHWINHKNLKIDNPDQRISEDIDLFTSMTLTLGIGILNSTVTLFSFLGILWSLGGPYLVSTAFLCAILGTLVTHQIGKPLVALNIEKQHREADFRFGLIQLRQNAPINSHGLLKNQFKEVVNNYWAIMNRSKLLGWWTYSYQQVGFVLPFLIAAPKFFAKQIQLGAFMQTVSAFSTVQTALSFVIDFYTHIAQWRSVVRRLAEFGET